MPDQAEGQFRSAISTDNGNAAAHAELAILLERKGDVSNARTEAETSVRLKPNVDGLLVLARLDLKQNQVPAAMAEVNRALALEPGNAPAALLKHDIAAKQTGSQ
jgi:Flp pilus assembly protein TadD